MRALCMHSIHTHTHTAPLCLSLFHAARPPPPAQGGDARSKKKVVKASEKFKFHFDWDAKEDTSKDVNPLYNSLHREAAAAARVAGAWFLCFLGVVWVS